MKTFLVHHFDLHKNGALAVFAAKSRDLYMCKAQNLAGRLSMCIA